MIKKGVLVVFLSISLIGLFSTTSFAQTTSAQAASTQALSVQERSNAESTGSKVHQFITCPVYRDADAGPKSGCWLGTDNATGNTFDITGGLTKPFMDRAVLVEGVEGDEDKNMCGAIVLRPIRTSVLLGELCSPHIIPAEGFTGRRFVLPKTRMSPMNIPRILPEPPFKKTEFHVLFNFNSDFINYQYAEVVIENLSLVIKAAKPESITITGFAATKDYRVSNRTLAEPADIAMRRAEKVKLALTRLGIDSEIITIVTNLNPGTIVLQEADLTESAVPEETKRRVDIKLNIR